MEELIRLFSGMGPLGGAPEINPQKRLQAAKQKAEQERNLPAIPMTYMPPFILMPQLFAQRQQWDNQEKDDGQVQIQMKETLVGNEIFFSSKPLSELKPILLRDMQIRKRHDGNYLLCRIISPPSRLVCVSFGVEDSNGWSQLLSLYNFPGTYEANGSELDTLFPLHTVLAIREPYCKMALAANHSHIRIDSPSDVVILEPGDPLLPNIRWSTGDRPLPVLSRSAAQWKEAADRHFKAKEYFAASVAYSYALRRNSSLIALRLNRSLAHLRLGNFVAALRDTQIVLENPKLSKDERIKALYRSAQAEYGREHYQKAKDMYSMCLKINPDLKDAENGLENCDRRIDEQSLGKYDWTRLFIEAKKKFYKPDVANFVGPVEISEMENRGGGRGVRATRDIDPGELLVVERPFVSATKDESPELGCLFALNFLTNTIDGATQYAVHQKAATKASCQASSELLYKLYGGPQFPPITQSSTPVLLESPLHFSEDVNVGHIQAACSLNQFGYGRTASTATFVKEPTPAKDLNTATALYLLSSYFNHSCIPNAHRNHLGDLMIIRAVKKIRKGEEITIAYLGVGATLDDRTKDLKKWVERCDCDLCKQDRTGGVQQRKQRREILEEINQTATSIERLRKLVKQIDGLYTLDYPLFRVQASEAHHKLATRLQELSLAMPLQLIYEDSIQHEMAALEMLGIRVIDKKMTEAPKSKAGRLPISAELIPYDPWRVAMLCLMIGAGFSTLDIAWRAERWIAAAVWCESANSGGGIELFKLKYADVMKTLGPVAELLLSQVEKSKYPSLK